jgi:hypothetical protein
MWEVSGEDSAADLEDRRNHLTDQSEKRRRMLRLSTGLIGMMARAGA